VVNNIISRALWRAEVFNIREPRGGSREDEKKPDGRILVLWSALNRAYALCPTQVSSTARQPGAVAAGRPRKTEVRFLGGSLSVCPNRHFATLRSRSSEQSHLRGAFETDYRVIHGLHSY